MTTHSRTLNTAPAELPVSVDDQKLHSTIMVDDDDSIVEHYIAAATDSAEMFLHRRLVSQTWTLYIDYAFPSEIELPDPPLDSVSSIKYLDRDGIQQTLAASAYTVDNKRQPGRVVKAYDQSWPATRHVINAIELEYVAGYGAASAVPAHIKQAVMIIAAHFYEHREPIIVGRTVNEIPMSAANLLRQDKVYLV